MARLVPLSLVTDGGDPSVCMSDEEGILIWSFIVSAFCVGGIIGGAGIGWVSTYCGRWVTFT